MALGVTKEEFMDSTPEELKPYIKSYELKQKRKDSDMWQFGIYMMSAVQAAVQSSLFGKKAKAKYMEEPLLQKEKEDERELTENEKKSEREKLLMTLQLMQANFEINHKKD